MASVNASSSASNIYAALGIKNKGIGGLATGLDTDSLVAALTAGTKAKIAKQGQDKQLLNWKMTAYRSMTTALRAFQSKSFSNTSMATNIMSSSFFNTYKATSSSGKISVSAGASAVTGNFTIDKINRLATTESLKSKTSISKDLVLGGLTDGQAMANDAFTGETLKISYNGSIKTIKLDSLNDAIVGGQLDLDELQTKLQDLIDIAIPKKNAYNPVTDKYDLPVSTVVVGTTADGKLKLDSDSARLVIEGDNSVLGISGGDTNRVNLNTKIGDIDIFKNSLQGDVLKFDINGTEITVGKNDTLNTLITKINSSGAGVRMSYSLYTDEFTLTSSKTGGGENIVMRDVQGNLMNTLFGAQSANGFGTNYLVTSDVSTSQDITKLLNYNYAPGSDAMKDLASKLGKMEFDITINGVTKFIKLDTTAISSDKLSKGTFTLADIHNAMNKAISNAFGTTDVKFSAEFDSSGVATGKTVIKTTNGASATLDGDRGGLMDLLGFTGPVGNISSDYNSLTFGDLMAGQSLNSGTLTISDGTGNANGEIAINYTPGMSIQDFVDQINNASNGAITASVKNGQLSVVTKSGHVKVEDTGSLLKDVFKTDDFETQAQAYAAGAHTAGQNAEIVVDGNVLSEFSNTFTINGVTITLNDVTLSTDAKININVVSDPDDVVKKISSWIDDYNALVFTLNSAINESKNRDYFPLTDEQKSEMTEDQIKTWEAEAKKGVLRNDSTLKDILSQLRQSLYEKVESAGISLYDIGITTKRNAGPNEAGQLEFDTNITGGGEARLRAMLENNPDKVRLLFTDANNGIAVKMNSIINRAANTSSVDRGSLVRIAGTEIPTGDNTSILGDKISAIDKYIASLKTRMEAEYARQWKKFSALEVAVQRMSAQSSWLNQS